MTEILRLKVTLRGVMCDDFSANYCVRTIDISDDDSLDDLAFAIITAYEFDMDHAFGYYNNVKNYYDSDEVYTSFVDVLDDPDPMHGKSVRKTKIKSVFEQGKTMLFLFDYGDEWIFHVTCLSVGEVEKGVEYPIVVVSKGKAPEQYPSVEESA